MKELNIEKLQTLLATRKRITILPHKNPDGDALGSSLALYASLKDQHDVKIIAPNDFPQFLKWLPYNEVIEIFEESYKGDMRRFIQNSDLIFILDFNALHRIDELGDIVQDAQGLKIMIDHHEQPEEFDMMYSDPSMSATAEMMYYFLEKLVGKQSFNKAIATCLYTGIMTDTGSFRYPSTSANTHRVIADLIELGADKTQIHGNVYDSNSISRFKLIGKALQNLVVFEDLKTSYITLSSKELQECNFKKGDTEGIVNYGLALKGIVFTAIFIEDKEMIKISLRSKGNFDVNQFSRKHFNGGGHVNAAGGKSEDSLDNTVANFRKILPQYKEYLLKTIL
ncbi:MAG: DHH family phosphoesterase [Flavobacteriales bacterium]